MIFPYVVVRAERQYLTDVCLRALCAAWEAHKFYNLDRDDPDADDSPFVNAFDFLIGKSRIYLFTMLGKRRDDVYIHLSGWVSVENK